MNLLIIPSNIPEVSNSLAAAFVSSVPRQRITPFAFHGEESVAKFRWDLRSLSVDFDRIVYYVSNYNLQEKAKLELIVDYSVRMGTPLIVLAPFAFGKAGGRDTRARDWYLDRADELEGRNTSTFLIGNYTPTKDKSQRIVELISDGMFGRYDLDEADGSLVRVKRNVQL